MSKIKLDKKKKIIAIVVVLLLACGILSCAGQGSQQSDPASSSSSSSSYSSSSDKNESATLQFSVEGDNVSSSDGTIVVTVKGKTDNKKSYNEDFEAELGKKYSVDVEAGEYTFSVAIEKPTDKNKVYVSDSVTYSFDNKTSHVVELKIALDEAATQVKQKAAEEEAAAKKAAEEQAAAEQAAAEQAAAEQAAAEQAAAEQAAAAAAAAQVSAVDSANASTNNSQTVYITDTGTKYHSDGCSYLKKSKQAISLDAAIAQGYTACSKCGG